MPWRWDENTKRYRDESGRYISRSRVYELLEESIRYSTNVSGSLANHIAEGRLSVRDWHEMMKQQLKEEYIRQYLVGVGGRSQMKPSDWGRLGAMLKEQYKYLDKFADQIASGQFSEAYIANRASMYFNSAREAYEKAHSLSARAWGTDEVHWRLGMAEHCPTCLKRASVGYMPAGPNGGFMDGGQEYFPGDGGSECLTNCHCGLDHRNSTTGKEYDA